MVDVPCELGVAVQCRCTARVEVKGLLETLLGGGMVFADTLEELAECMVCHWIVGVGIRCTPQVDFSSGLVILVPANIPSHPEHQPTAEKKLKKLGWLRDEDET